MRALEAAVHLGAFSDAADPEAETKAHTQIAGDQLRAFFIGANRLISPYDGGMDVILESPAACQAFKVNYADWLLKRTNGL